MVAKYGMTLAREIAAEFAKEEVLLASNLDRN
jgi:hypothetical protein